MLNLITPSGEKYNELDLEILRLMFDYGFVRRSDVPFTLKSGIQSYIYVFGREDLTDHPDLERLIGIKLCQVVREYSEPSDGQECLIGLPSAGTPFAQAAAMMSACKDITVNNHYICHRILKEVRKDHGAHKGWINGKPDPGRQTYWRVDNVATNGDTKLQNEPRFKEDGYPSIDDNPHAAPCLIWIDRQQGAVPLLRKAGYTRIAVVYNLLDITYAYGEMELWPKDAIDAVIHEIEAHQFLVQKT